MFPPPVHPHLDPYTVDDVFDLAHLDVRCQALDGCLIVAPVTSRRHERAVANLAELWVRHLPPGVETLANNAIRLPDGAGAVPDLLVTTATEEWGERGLPVAEVPTVVEVVSPYSRQVDRAHKPDLYARAGIPCYWRVELDAWRGYYGPLPLVVVRVRQRAGWRDLVLAAGQESALPVAVGEGPVEPALAWVRLDPAALTAQRSAAP